VIAYVKLQEVLEACAFVLQPRNLIYPSFIYRLFLYTWCCYTLLLHLKNEYTNMVVTDLL